MKALAGTFVRWLLHHFLTLLLIICVLLLGKVGWAEWNALQSVRVESVELVQAGEGITAKVDRLARTSTERAARLRSASLQTLETRIASMDQDIASLELLEKQQSGSLRKWLAGEPIVQAQLDGLWLAAQIHILEQERSYLLDMKLRLVAIQSEQALRAERGRLRGIHQLVYSNLLDNRRAQEMLLLRHPVKSRIGFGSTDYDALKQLKTEEQRLLTNNRRANDDYQRQDRLLQNPRPLALLGAYELRRSEVDAILQPLRARLTELDHLRAGNWFEKLLKPVHEVAPTALLLLLGVIFTPVGIKVLFYFALAPLAARRMPIRLLPETTGALELETGHSAVSRSISVDAAHELLVHPEFLQSSSIRGEKDTRWLLDWKFPFTSLASNMVALTRIRTVAPESFVISATRDPFSEIGILSLPQGAALVMQPHNLVGVVQPRGSQLRITSHWRLNSLHAWLTLQLRYLAFHGPARLIVQGCRGVRLERADAGRSINQAATIGFSANLAYSTRRSETFGAYLLGKQELLNDVFDGDCGFYVYEEMPHFGKKSGMTGRGLEGFTDSLLKVLGV